MVVGYIDAIDGCTNGSVDRITDKQDVHKNDLKDNGEVQENQIGQIAVPEKILDICCRTTTDKDQIAETVVDVSSSCDESTAECYSSSDDESNALDTFKNNQVPGTMTNELNDCKDFWVAKTVNITNNYQKQTLDVEQLKYLADECAPKISWTDGFHNESIGKAQDVVSHRLRKAVAIGLSTLTLVLVVIVVAVELWQLNRTEAVIDTDNQCGKGRLVTRTEWGALEPKTLPADLEEIPPQIVIVASTNGPNCATESECREIVQNFQISAMSRGASDILFNFLVGGDCNIYEGVGWNKTGNHTISFNEKSIGLAFIGTFMTSSPAQAQVDSGLAWLEGGVQSNNLAPDYVVFVQKQVTPFESPGVQMIPFIKRWKHWSANITVTPTTFDFNNTRVTAKRLKILGQQ